MLSLKASLFFYLAAVAFQSCFAQTCTSSDQLPCLVPAEGSNLALRWLQIFQTDSNGVGTGGAIVDSTLSQNFTYYDEGASFGSPDPVYNSSQAVYESVTGSGYSGSLVTDVQYSVVQSLVGCNFVVCRWESNSKAANATNVTVAVGTPIQYAGTDYLMIDLSTRLIYNVTSSSDLLNYYTQLGDDIIANGGSKQAA